MTKLQSVQWNLALLWRLFIKFYVQNLYQHNISMALSVSLYSLNGQTLCLIKVIVGWTFAKNGRKMSDVRPLFQTLVWGNSIQKIRSVTGMWLAPMRSLDLKVATYVIVFKASCCYWLSFNWLSSVAAFRLWYWCLVQMSLDPSTNYVLSQSFFLPFTAPSKFRATQNKLQNVLYKALSPFLVGQQHSTVLIMSRLEMNNVTDCILVFALSFPRPFFVVELGAAA